VRQAEPAAALTLEAAGVRKRLKIKIGGDGKVRLVVLRGGTRVRAPHGRGTPDAAPAIAAGRYRVRVTAGDRTITRPRRVG